MSRKFAERGKLVLSNVNKEILEEWKSKDIFHRSITEKDGCPDFIFFEGPPSANGHPGIHHVMGRTIKDTILRYKTMKGFKVERKAGWDTHGLPVELSVEKSLGITKEDIGKKISVDGYNDACRKNVMMYTGEWTELTDKMGYWVDLEHPYITYDNKYIETLWWLLKQLYGKGLLYKGYTIQPYSPAAGTGLSSHELNQPGCYRDVKDTTVTAQFLLKDAGNVIGTTEGLKAYALAWTTTPWTLPSNTALCVGPSIDYVAVKGTNPYSGEKAVYLLAELCLDSYFRQEEDAEGNKTPLEIIWHGKGSELVGLRYEQLMPWVSPCSLEDDAVVDRSADAFRVIPGDYVTTDEGTGIVHIAPTFGADDAMVAKDAGIPSLFVIDKAGDTRPMVDFQGKYFVKEDMDQDFAAKCVHESYWKHSGDYVKNAYDPKYNVGGKYDEKAAQKDMDLNVVICLEMKEEGAAFKIEKHVHNYPHCWRTDKPVLYYPLDSWFIRSTACKERMAELNRTIKWKPEATGTGRFGKWLENLNDWNLSRSRYWGTPLPIWRNKDTREEICIGSVEELYNEVEKAVSAGVMQSNPLKDKGFVPGDMSQENYDRIDLHRPYVDDIKLVGANGSDVLTRELDLIDVWFDSGAMPYAQIHYPFENREALDSRKCYPADFIAEGVDQTRGWFFTLHAIATMIFDSVAYKAVISNGLVLDKFGVKMSKRLGNVIDPFKCIADYGADPVRWYMITNSAPWDNLSFDIEGVKEVSGSFFLKLQQTYGLLAMYANVDGWDNSEATLPMEKRTVLDRWILSELGTLVKDVTEAFDDYEPTRAGRAIQAFAIDNLSNWYVRLAKKRLWGEGLTEDKLACYQTLHECLLTLSKLIAPISPFFADMLYHDLTAGGGKDSVHLDSFPVADESCIDKTLEHDMERVQKICSMALSLRKKEKIGVRQPLQCIAIPVTDLSIKDGIERLRQIILEELNVKDIRFIEGHMVEKKVKPNFRVMGKKFGKLMKDAAVVVTALSQEQIAVLEQGKIEICVGGSTYGLVREDVEISAEDMPGWSVTSEGVLTVALDITVTPELRLEGVARDLVRGIQNLRKESGLEITDRIRVTLPDSEENRACLESFGSYMSTQVLADSIEIGDALAVARS